MPRAFFLDGTALAYRSHFAIGGLTTPEGRPSGATYGFTLTLRRILETEAPDRIAVAFDPPGPTFRHRRFEAYKATRERAPEEMIAQLGWLREITRAHGIPVFEVPGFEADDVIGTLTAMARTADYDVFIVTGDKDFMQLVDDRVRLYNVFKRDTDVAIEGIREVEAKFGAPPERVIDVLAIMGDASDNIPGVKGIGEKGAVKLIQQFGSVDNMLAHLDQVPGKAREYIERDRASLELSRELATIRCDVPLDPGFDGLRAPEPDPEKLAEIFRRLGFQSLLKKVGEASTDERSRRDYRIVTNHAELERMLAELRAHGSFAMDSETTSLFPLEAELVGLSFSAEPFRAWYVPFHVDPPVVPGGPAALLEALRPLLVDPSLQRTGQNYKYDALVLAGQGVRVPPPEFDTMVASYCAAGATRPHNLDDLALRFFNLRKIPTSELIGKGAKQTSMKDVPVERVAEYACEDADVTWRLRPVLEQELKENEATELFRKLEMPLVPVLTSMEERGIRIDTALLARLSEEFQAEIEREVQAIQELAGETVNVNSPKRLGEILFEKLRIQDQAGVRRPKRTKTGWATDFDTLSLHYGDVAIVRRLLEYREVAKLKNTYLDALPRFVNPRTGRVHCSFSQVTAATGRLASSDPNLQNIPVRTERGRRLREAFVPREPDQRGEWVFLSADYSQVELRVLAHLSGDELMQRAFEEDRDIHASTAAIVFGVAPGEVSREMRSRAKAVNFGVLYGMGAARLARETGLSLVEARQFIERYFASFPRVRGWREEVLERARSLGYVETLFGRRRRIPEIQSTEPRTHAQAENVAINTPVQGTAADIIKRAMIDIEAALVRDGLATQMLLQVHDELLFEVPVSEIEEARAVARRCMEGAASLSVPLRVDFGQGRNWLEAH